MPLQQRTVLQLTTNSRSPICFAMLLRWLAAIARRFKSERRVWAMVMVMAGRNLQITTLAATTIAATTMMTMEMITLMTTTMMTTMTNIVMMLVAALLRRPLAREPSHHKKSDVLPIPNSPSRVSPPLSARPAPTRPWIVGCGCL